MRTDFQEITRELGERYRTWKHSEKEKNETKSEFFDAITEKIRTEAREREIIRITADSEEQARARMAQYFPTMEVKAVTQADANAWEFIAEPDAAYEPYTYVNPEDGMVYSRQISAGKLELDEELLKSVEPELYERVTYIPEKRELKPIEELDPEDMAAISEYMYEGKPTVKLGAPRKAKPEELE